MDDAMAEDMKRWRAWLKTIGAEEYAWDVIRHGAKREYERLVEIVTAERVSLGVRR